MKMYPDGAAQYEKLVSLGDSAKLPELEVEGRGKASDDDAMVVDQVESFEEGEEILVMSKTGLLWDAKVLCRSEIEGKVRYRVQYKGWEGACEWVESDEKVGESDEHHRLRKKTRQAEGEKDGLWAAYCNQKRQLFSRVVPLDGLAAWKSVNKESRNRGYGWYEQPCQQVSGNFHRC